MEVTIISVESIKPSVLVCNHGPFRLSLLDQLNPRTYAPLILFYPLKESCTSETISIINKLKDSLSQTLNLFYTLSGRVQNNLFISNYDGGIPFTISRVKGQLSSFLQERQLELLNLFLPYEPFCLITDPSLPQVAIQANIFDCGGLVLGLSFLHKICDGKTMDYFLQSWAANTSGSFVKVIQPNLSVASSLFPPLERPLSKTFENFWFKKGSFSVKRFVFDEKAIAALRTKSKSEEVENPSRVQATLAFIWKSAMAASKRAHNSQKPSILMQAKDIRPVIETQCSNRSIGNLWLTAATRVVETEMELNDLVVLMKEGLDQVNSNFVKPANIVEILKGAMGIWNQNLDIFFCTSWNIFGFDSVDFGWGKPVWCGVLGKTSNTYLPIPNMMVLKRVAGNRNAIEAWMWLNEEVAAVLENDPEFLAFVSPNPIPF